MSVHAPDQKLVDAIREKAVDEEIACAAVFAITEELKTDPSEAGRALDLMDISIVKCQLGLFGYKPEKKIVRPAESVPQALNVEITAALVDGRLPCASAWSIAAKLHIAKMEVAAACDKLGLKISRCQLGAF
jgi:hypothetical protein